MKKYLACSKKDLIILFLMPLAFNSWAIDLTPGEIKPLSEGTDFFQLSLLETKREGAYKDGKLFNSSAKLEAQQWLLRYGRFDRWQGVPTYFHVEMPFLSIDTQGSLAEQSTEKGLGDINAAFALWPYADIEKQRYWAVGGYVILPTGRYEPDKIYNPGNNRYSLALQTAYQADLTSNLIWMSAFDGIWFGTNHNFGIQKLEFEQRPFFTVQTGGRFLVTQSLSISASLIKTDGGESRINNYYWSEPYDIRRYQVGIYQHFAKDSIAVQYGGDISTEQGLYENYRWNIRWTHFL